MMDRSSCSWSQTCHALHKFLGYLVAPAIGLVWVTGVSSGDQWNWLGDQKKTFGWGWRWWAILFAGVIFCRYLSFLDYSHAACPMRADTEFMFWSQGTDPRSHPVGCYKWHCCQPCYWHSSQFNRLGGWTLATKEALWKYLKNNQKVLWELRKRYLKSTQTRGTAANPVTVIHHNFHQESGQLPIYNSVLVD